jgi:hypothetical protein
MASEWVKIRRSLLNAPKLIAMTAHLRNHAGFQRWLWEGLVASKSAPVLSESALRCVTVTLLMCVWSAASEFGKMVRRNLLLPAIALPDLDKIAGAPGVGEAMAQVGWALPGPGGKGVLLPNFKENNMPASAAERQKKYRERKKKASAARHSALRAECDSALREVAPRGEESREEKKREEFSSSPLPPSPSAAPPGQGDFERTPEGLAQRWCFLYRGTVTAERDPYRVAKVFAEWLEKLRLDPGRLEAAIADPARDCTEPTWLLKERLCNGRNSERRVPTGKRFGPG